MKVPVFSQRQFPEISKNQIKTKKRKHQLYILNQFDGDTTCIEKFQIQITEW